MSTRRALFYSFIDRYSGLVLSVISSMVIARLLKPEEIGVFSVAMAMLAFAATLRDMGAGQYVVQATEVTDDLLRAVWTIQFGLGTVLAALVAALAYPLAGFYEEPRIAPIMGVMALTYLVIPVGSITYALLMRDMRFQHVAVMRFASGLVAAVVAIGLAWRGFGPISLAWSLLASSVVTALTAQLYRRKGQPWGFSFKGARAVLRFGGRVTGTSFINTFAQGMPDFALGKLQGMTAAGLYSRSNGLVAMYNRLLLDAVYGVAVAHFAKRRREGGDAGVDFIRAVAYLVPLNVAFAIAIVAFADPITRLLYGSQWGESVALTRWLAVAAAMMAAHSVCAALITGHGRADLLLKATLVSAAFNVSAVIGGAMAGLHAIGPAVLVANACSAVVWLVATRRARWFSVRAFCLQVLRSTATALLGCLPVPLLVWHFGLAPSQPMAFFFVALPVCVASFVVALFATRHPLAGEIRGACARVGRRNQRT